MISEAVERDDGGTMLARRCGVVLACLAAASKRSEASSCLLIIDVEKADDDVSDRRSSDVQTSNEHTSWHEGTCSQACGHDPCRKESSEHD